MNPYNGIESFPLYSGGLVRTSPWNPYNGIERSRRLKCSSTHLVNPYNGIERQVLRDLPEQTFISANPYNGIESVSSARNLVANEAISLNPYNGIESKEQQVVCDSTMKARGINTMELKEGGVLDKVIDNIVMYRIHTMELKARGHSCAPGTSGRPNPYNGIESL